MRDTGARQPGPSGLLSARESRTSPEPGGQISDLLAMIHHARGRPVHKVVLGPAGTGKTTTLRLAHTTFEALGVPVVSGIPVSGEKPPAGSAVLIDDAHRLGPTAFEELEVLLRERTSSVVIAARPRTNRQLLDRLLSSTDTDVVNLAHLNAKGISLRARQAVGRELHQHETTAIFEITAGRPDGVHEILAALRQDRSSHSLTTIQLAGNAWLTRRFAALPPLVQQAIAVAEVTVSVSIVSTTLGVSEQQAERLLDEARDSALLLDHDAVSPHVTKLFAQHIGATKLSQLRTSIAEALCGSHALTLTIAQGLAKHNVTSPAVASFLVNSAERCAHSDPAHAAELLDAARSAGAHIAEIALLRADVAARTGDFANALHFADAVTNRALNGDPARSAAGLASAIRISATVATARGMVPHAADLYRWLGPSRTGADRPIAAVVLFAAGDAGAAREFLNHADEGIPTTYAQGLRLLAEGVDASMAASGRSAIALLARSVSMLSPPPVRRAMPDHAATLAATAALHCGDIAAAQSILDTALSEDRPEKVVTARLQLLDGWAAMLAGDPQKASERMASLTGDLTSPRDKLFEYGLRAGIARRADNAAELSACWAAARPVLAACTADLFSLLPIGELWIAAAHLSQDAEVQHLVDQASRLLDALGSPALWAALFHWCGVQAAIIADKPDSLAPHANKLGSAAQVSSYASALAGAGRTWIRVLARDFDPTEVETSARTLADTGHRWDGARLAAEAAFRSCEPRIASGLLQLARALRMPGHVASANSVSSVEASSQMSLGGLSRREAEIANLVVQGFPYREIGERLFIAPKTVEHHVARIRQRLGAQNRSEMLTMLRTMGFPHAPPTS